MFTGSLNLLLAKERTLEMRQAASRARLEASHDSPVTRVTLRHAVAADAPRLRELAQLDCARPPAGRALVAEVDGRLRAVLPLDGGPPIADPFHRGLELIELLRLRAAQLAA